MTALVDDRAAGRTSEEDQLFAKCGHRLIPFVVLLGARPKKHVGIRVVVAAVSLSGIWLERYLAIVPSVNHGAGPALGLPEVGVTAFFAGVFLLAYAWFGARFPMVSPRLAADTLERERHH